MAAPAPSPALGHWEASPASTPGASDGASASPPLSHTPKDSPSSLESPAISALPRENDASVPHEKRGDLESPPAPASDDPNALPENAVTSDDSYSVFLPGVRLFIVACASASGFMSPFSINIYLPALPEITDKLHISSSKSLVSVTMYMLLQGLSPSVWAPISDAFGRWPVLLITFAVFLAANLGLSFANTYWALLVLRMAQASGASSAIAIGSGCISDVSQRAQRGTYMGWFQSGVMVGPAIGPVIGGLVSQRWHWHSVFFFLSGFGGVFLMFQALFLPESLRALVGNGSLRPIGIWRTLVPIRLVPPEYRDAPHMHRPKVHLRAMGFDRPWRMFGHLDVALLIALYALPFGTYTMVSSALSTVLNDNYGLTALKMGLCYITLGTGAALGSVISGKVIDRDYAIHLERHGAALNLHRVRLKNQVVFNAIFSVFVIANGWTLDRKVHLAAPLICQFCLALLSTLYFNSINTLLVDLFPTTAASVTAALNIGRCIFGAVCVAIVQPMINGIGYGWTFFLAACVTFFGTLPILAFLWYWGAHYKHRRDVRAKEKK